MRSIVPFIAVAAVAACEPAVEVRQGVGFQDYSAYQQQQAFLERSRSAPQTAAAVAAPAPASTPAPDIQTTQTAASNTEAQAPGAPLSAFSASPVISDEQSFSAVSARETIESDRERLARQRAEYQTIEPAPVPQRTGPSGPNIAAFALETSHPIGQQMYRRSNPFRNSAFERACARYASDSLAQEAFLAAGGPERDRLNLDPDGDGYACRWDPSPFRFVRS